MAQTKKGKETENRAAGAVRLAYAGPALPLYGLAHGHVYVGGIPKTAPNVMGCKIRTR